MYVRLTVDDAGSVFQFSEKFGTDAESAAALLRHARTIGLRPYGLSFHVGSQARNLCAWANAIRIAAEVIATLENEGIRLDALNIGGGFPCQYALDHCVPRLADIATGVADGLSKLPYRLQLLLEPGRAIVADAAVFVVSIIGRVQRQDRTWLFLDGGVYNGLFEAMAYQGATRYAVESVQRPEGTEAPFALAGPTGDSPDVITREALLPADLGVGDRLIVRNAGAYTLAVTSRFNGFPPPDVHFA